MIETTEILYRWSKHKSRRAIAQSLGYSRNTVKDIIEQAKALGLRRDCSQERFDAISEKIINERYQLNNSPTDLQATLKKLHHQIASLLDKPHMTTRQMYRLLSGDFDIGSESSLRRYLKTHFPKAISSTIPLHTLPGQEAQVDFGYVGLMFDPITKRRRRTNAFIMTLSHSRMRFVYFVFRQDAQTWIDCHVRAFRFFGGVPNCILLDNLKAGVIKPDIFDPTLNKAYAECEKYYNFIADPAIVATPEHKGKVERSVPMVRQQILAGREFKDIQEANEVALHWALNEISQRVTRTTGEKPWERFVRDEKNILLPLPEDDFEFPTWKEVKVQRDQHVVFLGSFYSVPFEHVGKQCSLRVTLRCVKCFYKSKLIKTHTRASRKGEWKTDPLDFPKSARAFLDNHPDRCIERAKTLGSSIGIVVSKILSRRSKTNLRKAQAILRLEEKFTSERLEAACQRAIHYDNLAFNSIKRILELRLDELPLLNDKSAEESIVATGAYLRSPNDFNSIH